MQGPVAIVDSETMLSYFHPTARNDPGLNRYLSCSEQKDVETLSSRSHKNDNVDKKHLNIKQCSSPKFQTFHQLPYGEFNPNFYNPFQTKHRRRTTKEQYKVLEASYLENSKPNSGSRRKLSLQLNMTARGVQVWFQNRRAKSKLYRREGNSLSPLKARSLRLSRRASSVSTQSSISTSIEGEEIAETLKPPLSSFQYCSGDVHGMESHIDNCTSITPQKATPDANPEQSEFESNHLVDLLTGTDLDHSIWSEFDILDQPQIEESGYCSYQGSSLCELENYLHHLQQSANPLYPNCLDFSNLSLGKASDVKPNSQYTNRCMITTFNNTQLYTPPQDAFMHRQLSCPLPSASREIPNQSLIHKNHLDHSVSFSHYNAL